MRKIEINRPKIEEIELINEFFEIVIKDTFKKNGIDYLEDSINEEIDYKRKILKEFMETNGENRYFLIAKENEKIVGSIEYGQSSEFINSCTHGALKDVVEIGTVFVHPSYQGEGIGSRMLDLILLELQKRGIKEFCFDSGYKTAQKIWKNKFGNPDFYLKDFWGENEDHMIWRLKVKDALI